MYHDAHNFSNQLKDETAATSDLLSASSTVPKEGSTRCGAKYESEELVLKNDIPGLQRGVYPRQLYMCHRPISLVIIFRSQYAAVV